jgi:quinol monooxygenase YgiN
MHHKVEDFDKWKKVFDDLRPIRIKAGELNYSIGTIHGQPNTAYVINGWKTMKDYEAFLGSSELAEAMKKAAVLEKQHTFIMDEVEMENKQKR